MTNNQDTNNTQSPIIKDQNRKFDLEQRTTDFAKTVIDLCRQLPKNEINVVFVRQVIRSSGSMGANYREANDALGKKDFILRMRIARKETKESIHWLELIGHANPTLIERVQVVQREAIELRNIFSAIITKSAL